MAQRPGVHGAYPPGRGGPSTTERTRRSGDNDWYGKEPHRSRGSGADSWRARRALNLADTTRGELTDLGYTVLGDHTPIVTAPDRVIVFLACRHTPDRRLYVEPVASPCLRISFTAAHTIDHLEHLRPVP